MIFRLQTSFLILFAFLLLTHSLHLQENTNPELQTLKDKQQYIREEVKTLSSYTSNLNKQLQNATSDKQKVQILQQALTDERQSIFLLKNKIIYPLNQSETACQQLTEQQKTLYRQKINNTRAQLTKLQQINQKLNQASPQVQHVNDDIQKQFILLQNMQDILDTQCKENLTPTIFQSNLKSKNWILGPQTMKDLKQEYAQRALIFHNITNCPLETPFYDPNTETCIKCQSPDPIFNMFTKECTHCEQDEELDNQKKICSSKPHYTNFTKVKNWNLDGGNLPEIDKNLTPCPDDKPYFNGVICIPCDLPLYWSVSANLCKKCESGFSFDLNTKNCQKIVKYELTILQNTKWVSENLTKVLEERARILEKNKTTGNYHYCPDKTSPFYDGTTCIYCDYFDIDKFKCVKKPNGTEYDENMKRFLAPESKKETNPSATRYISSKKLTDSDLSNCNSSHPYYDGLACIQCLNPFDIFNVDEKKCISCNRDEIYVENLHICKPRNKIRISQNFNRLLATPKVSVPQYKQSLISTINNNPDAIIYPCEQKNQYSNQTDCFPCSDGEYFNVEILKCQGCDGVYFDNNQTCKAKVYIFTNLKAPKIVDLEGTTVDAENSKITEFLKTHPDSVVCPLEKPYAIENKTCGTCPDLFSYSELKCKSCEEFNIFVENTRKCVPAKMLVNFTDAHRILVSETETLASFKEQEQKVKNENPNTWKVCPGDKPFTDNRDSCFNCSGDTPYFNYTIKQCQDCPDHYVFDPSTVKCTQQFFITLINSDTEPRMLGYDNYTMTNFKADQDAYKKSHPTVLCNASEPFGTLTGCKQCNEPTSYFDIKKKDCSEVNYLINFQKISPDYILPTDKNLDFYVAEEEKFRKEAAFLTKKCPDLTPYTNDRTYCFNCSSGEYFNFLTKQCEKCPEGQAYMKQLKSCKQLFYVSKITPVTQINMKGYPNYTLDAYKVDQADIKSKNPYQQCSDTAPYGTVNGCQQCSDPTPYFDIKKLICSGAKKLINFSSIGNNYILGDAKNLSSYQENQNNFKLYSESLTVDCPAQTPFTSDRQNCFVCKEPETLFNFETKKCESCPRGAQFSSDKKKCQRLFYITNFNVESQKKMVGTQNYGIADYKTDQQKLRRQNPYKDCNTTEPYGTLDGCKKCLLPEEYFDIKNRACTAVKTLINFDSISNNYILKQGRTLEDYRKDEQNYAQSSTLPTVNCSSSSPFTNNHDDCFVCTSPKLYFNFESKNCQSCAQNETYDQNTRRCSKKQYLTDFTNPNIKETQNFTIADAKKIENDRANKSGSVAVNCTGSKPFATLDGCIACSDSKAPYFNIKTLTCEGCKDFYQYFKDRKCNDYIILTNTEEMIGYFEVDNYTKYNVEKMNNFTFISNPNITKLCPVDSPFFRFDSVCVACNTSDAPIFNLKEQKCVNVDSVPLSNPQYMKFYIERGDSSMAELKREYDVLKSKGVNVVLCPQDKPYLSHNECVTCPLSSKYFDLATEACKSCDPGDNCISA